MSYTRDPYEFSADIMRDPFTPKILIEGDSWTDHPLVTNLAWQLNLYLKQHGARANLLNISASGDLIHEIASGKQFKTLSAYLRSSRYKFDILFLSGGGNDILANKSNQFSLNAILQPSSGLDPGAYINDAVWERALQRIKTAYRKILDHIADVAPTMAVYTHSYDYIYPRDKGTDIVVFKDQIGPWAWPVMTKKKGITDPHIMRAITSWMIDAFYSMLMELSDQYPFFHVIDSRGTLPEFEAWGLNIKYWDDEIHPDKEGFRKLIEDSIGQVIADKVRSL